MKQTQGNPGLREQQAVKERNDEVKKDDQIGGTWPNKSDTKQGPQPTGRTGPIDDVGRDEYDEPGEMRRLTIRHLGRKHGRNIAD